MLAPSEPRVRRRVPAAGYSGFTPEVSMRLLPLLLISLLPLGHTASRDLAPAEREALVSERRVALVIGNGAYPTGPLRNPPSDAQAMAASLDRYVTIRDRP